MSSLTWENLNEYLDFVICNKLVLDSDFFFYQYLTYESFDKYVIYLYI